ncbi:hypothetical protein AB4156_42360, partial [Cupriavidus sp. 2MCAB6]|uniref:hypothetical protein n=1 Tax=Cupriavidus sp. 2MCAB6 TaxID=3232981 RepID=UPI003F93D860
HLPCGEHFALPQGFEFILFRQGPDLGAASHGLTASKSTCPAASTSRCRRGLSSSCFAKAQI